MRNSKKENPKKAGKAKKLQAEANRFKDNPLFASKWQEYRLLVPYEFRMLCALLETPPEKMLQDFMKNAGFSTSATNAAHCKAGMEYILQCGYGQADYSPEQLTAIFKEMEAQRCLWPDNKVADTETLRLHAEWRDRYIEYWFGKWYWAVRSAGSEEVLHGL